MRKSLILAAMLFALCILAGCGAAETPADTQPVTEATAAEAPAETQPPVEAPTSEPAAQTTAPAEETAPAAEPSEEPVDVNDSAYGALSPEEKDALMQPVMTPPELTDEPCDFFDDAAILGDSISYSLMVYNTKHGYLGSPLFLVRGSLGVHNTQNKMMEVFYQGKSMTPWDALAASGVKKVFLMLGMNDIGYYGVEDTMQQWETFLAHIREVCPEIEVYIQSQTPVWTRGQKGLLTNENIDLYNTQLEEFAEENGCHFVNIAPYFKDHTNGLAEPYSGDKYVHMSDEGNLLWCKVLRAYAAEQEKETP